MDKASALGITPDQIAETVRVATIGDIDANLAKFTSGDRLIPIRVQVEEKCARKPSAHRKPAAHERGGKSIPLSAVAKISFSRGPSAIDRYDRERRAEIGGDLVKASPWAAPARPSWQKSKRSACAGRATAGDRRRRNSGRSGERLHHRDGHRPHDRARLLILLFGSVFQPITILLSLPLSFGGVVLALIATNNPVSMPVTSDC